MLILNSGNQANLKYSFILPIGKKSTKDERDLEGAVKMPVIKGGKVHCTTTEDGKRTVIKVMF